MNRPSQWTVTGALFAAALLLSAGNLPGYVGAAYSLAKVMQESSNILLLQIEKVDKEKNIIIFRKVRDLKGTHPGQIIKHQIGPGWHHARESQFVMAWAEVGKTAVCFHNGAASEMCIDNYWYQSYAGEWWQFNHGDPFLLRTFAGAPDKLASAVSDMLAGQEAVIPCMLDGNQEALHMRNGKIMRIKASTKILDLDQKRDFVGWGNEEFRPIAGMPGFARYASLSRVDPNAQGITLADFNGDGKSDLCLFGTSRLLILENTGAWFNEFSICLDGGARAAAWADFNGDGKPDLLLATPAGPRLFANEGKKFPDVTDGLPRQNYYNVTAAAWLDFDGDKRPDILLADGFRGLRLYRNKGVKTSQLTPKIGKWFYAGPFDNTDGKGFDTAYPPESGVEISKQYTGKNGEKVAWKEGNFRDGELNNLRIFKPELNDNAAVYLYREIEIDGTAEMRVSLGSDDTLTVWLNGFKVHSENVARGCAPDQAVLNLKLVPGKNTLLLKVCNGGGDYAFYFAMPKEIARVVPQLFEDVSDAVGLGANGIGGNMKGCHILVADVNNDGRQDFLYGAGAGLLAVNTGRGFVEAKDSGISYQPDQGSPVFGDFNGDTYPDLFVPQPGKCRLYQNDGKGCFADVTARSGALAKPIGYPVCAVWTDFNNSGRLDLLVGCLKGPNRYFRNRGDGTFADATEEIGLHQRIFNTRGIAALDVNNDKVPDVVFNNEGQEPVVLLGNPARLASAAARSRGSTGEQKTIR